MLAYRYWILGGALAIIEVFYFTNRKSVPQQVQEPVPRQIQKVSDPPTPPNSDPFAMDLKKIFIYIMDSNTIVYVAYHEAVISGLVITNSLIAKKILKVNPADLGKVDLKDAAMLTTNIYIAMMIKTALIQNKILPPNINTQNIF